MSLRIIVPANFPAPEIIANIESVCIDKGFELIKIDEHSVSEQFLRNRGSLALLSPIGYGKGVKSADYRIIPTLAAGLVAYSGRASLYFKSGLTTLNTIGAEYPDDFMMVIGKILLSERYDISAELKRKKGSVGEILNDLDAAMAYGIDTNYNSMDISEDWFESFEIPLPIGVWVCRNEEEPVDVVELTKLFAMDELPEEIEIDVNHTSYNNNGEREGRLITHWNDDMKSAFEQTLELLYYHRILPEIPAIKIY